MLHDFINAERAEILAFAQQHALYHHGVRGKEDTAESGWDQFLDELASLLERNGSFENPNQMAVYREGAMEKGKEYFRQGFTVSEVVHGYGNICQAITEVATSKSYPVTPREFRQLNLSLDTAIAEAVAAFELHREAKGRSVRALQLGVVSSDLQAYLHTASIALQMIQGGTVGVTSQTGGTLRTSLWKMTRYIDTSFVKMRLKENDQGHPAQTNLFELLSEVGVAMELGASARMMRLELRGDLSLTIQIDRHYLASSISNLVDMLFLVAPRGSTIAVTSEGVAAELKIEVAVSSFGQPNTPLSPPQPTLPFDDVLSLDEIIDITQRNGGSLDMDTSQPNHVRYQLSFPNVIILES